MSSATPLLSLLPRTRKDFLDNLRCALTILLVTHHALIQTAPASDSALLAVVATLVRSFLWSSFFFVSGYSTALSQGTRAPTLAAFLKKGLKVNLPALLYAAIAQWALFTLLLDNWPYIFGGDDKARAYARLSGPVPYILLLFLFDSGAHLLRQFTFPAWSYPNMAPKSLVLVAFIALALYTFLNAAFIVPHPWFPHIPTYLVYDAPGPSFPLSHILAYTAGWQFRSLKRSILSSSSRGATLGLVVSTASSSGLLYFAQLQWPPIARFIRLPFSNGPQAIFIDGGPNAHTAFYSLWSTFTLFAISLSLISLFFHMDATTSTWGWLGRKTYIQTYLHMIVILVAEYHMRRVRNEIVRYGLVELAVLSGTWLSSFIVYALLDLITDNVLKIKRFIKW